MQVCSDLHWVRSKTYLVESDLSEPGSVKCPDIPCQMLVTLVES